MEIKKIKNSEILLIKGDITEQVVDVIVNAANEKLVGGGGVDGAIHSKGGPSIMEECDKIRENQGGCPTGTAVYTTGGNLNAKYVIHTVGPIWKDGNSNEEQLLKNCYINSLKLAGNLNARTVAFPSISTGVYRFPVELAAEISINTVAANISTYSFKKIIFVLFSDSIYMEYKNSLNKLSLH
jgi:O-acetyl-ADP-ribose deacetylase (regulator of RNase III)